MFISLLPFRYIKTPVTDFVHWTRDNYLIILLKYNPESMFSWFFAVIKNFIEIMRTFFKPIFQWCEKDKPIITNYFLLKVVPGSRSKITNLPYLIFYNTQKLPLVCFLGQINARSVHMRLRIKIKIDYRLKFKIKSNNIMKTKNMGYDHTWD